MKRNIIILTEQWVCFKPLPQQFNNELGKSNRHTPTQNTIHDFIPTAWSQFPIGGNIPESNFYIKPETKAFRFPVFVFRIPADFSSLAIADVSISSEYTTPMCMLIFLYIPHVFHSFHAKYEYSLCKLQPVPNFVYMLCVPFLPITSKIARKYISLFDQIYTTETISYSFLPIEVLTYNRHSSTQSQKLFSGCNEFLRVRTDFLFTDCLRTGWSRNMYQCWTCN